VEHGKYFLADAGFFFNNALLVPYCEVCYHLSEWEHSTRCVVFIVCSYIISS
ncbi:hypothetical protein OBBRIDRAFT_736762, partial [Obba rivulosa]